MADRLSQKQFDLVARRAFGSVLEPHGFSCADSKWCTFYRPLGNDLYHFIVPDRLRRLPKFDIHVFAHSPVLDPENWETRFPDTVGFPTGSLSYLHSRTGVGPDQELYFCRTEEGLMRDFEGRVKPALITFALPFLDRIKSLPDLKRLTLHPTMAERLNAALAT